MEADGGIAIRSSRRTVFFIFFLVLPLLHSEFFIRSEAAAELPKDELAAFKQVAAKLGASELDFDPCSGGGWNDTSNDLGNGIFCNCSYNNNTVCHITSIVLKEQNFSGTLPPEMAQLKYLQTLDLTRNYINGTIPSTWSSLPLTNLTLHGNRISGSIPREIGNMTLLVTLFLESNELEGTIPEELGNLKNLERLLIGANRFTGRLPVALSKLVNLRDLRVHGNNFSGRIPASIQNLKRLETLMVFGTSLEGPIPDGISLLRNLTDMRIADIISPSSTFPNLTNLVNMKTLILRNCSISDEIPDYVGNMKKLKTLDLSFNKLTGEIPSSFADLKQIGFMYMMSNMLTGSVPVWALKSLKNLDFSNNNFTGASSSSDCGQGSLNLFGSYSSSKDSSIESCLKKDFPCDGVAKFYSLHINCGGKEIPVNGVKYEADLEIKGASTYYLQGNWAYSSSGNFMGDDSDADEYIVTNVSKLSFPAPELYMSARLSPLSLTYYGICLQNGPYEVELHFAEIVFTADKTFHSLGRRIFDVYIQGNCVLRDFNIEDEAGGVGIPVVRNFTANVTDNVLRIQFYWAGKGTISIPHRGVYGPLISAITVTPNFTPKNFDVEGSKLPVIATVFIVITACIILFLVIVIIYLKGWLGGKPKEDKELRSRLEQHTGYFTLKQIKSATGNFDQANKIGEGGFGPVYKGVLPDGRVVAVKKLSSKSRQGNREFVNEIGMISAVQHPNLVKLFGCCIEANQLMLIYEYLENNSLGRALFGKPQNRIKLDWPTRRRICIGIGKGLAYLHEESALKVIHRDVKASNVLLDKDLNAKISDFGLAKLHEEGKTHVSTRIAGTVGYMAPEYAMRGYLTDKADVYSFGVVILEMVSGKSNMSFKPLEEYVYLLDWVYVLHEKGSLLELVDPELGTNYPKDEVTRFIKIALLCTSPSTTLRPTMSSVVKMLDGRSVVQDPPPAGSFLSDDWMQKSRQISSDENITSTIEPEYESESSSFLVTEVTNNSTTMFSTKSENMKS